MNAVEARDLFRLHACRLAIAGGARDLLLGERLRKRDPLAHSHGANLRDGTVRQRHKPRCYLHALLALFRSS